MKLILGDGKTAKSITNFLGKQGVDFEQIADSRLLENTDVLSNIDEVFISPGIPQTQKIVIAARAKKIPVSSDIELFSRHATAPIIGITGSNGKSTVTQLLFEMIKNAGKKAAICGNIGIPALDCLAAEVDFYALELSSYQLDYTQNLTLKTGVVLNITPDHLDRYQGFADYKKSKLSLYDFCQKPVFNLDEIHTPSGDGFSKNLPKKSADFGIVSCHGSRYFVYGDEALMGIDEMKIIGEHNIYNALAALSLGAKIGLNISAMVQAIKDFKGLPHRLEWVCKKDEIHYYNDSKATNASATITAIKALSTKHQAICLILGGIKKREDYTELFKLINAKISAVVLIGESAGEFATKITTKTIQATSLKSAIHQAQKSHPNAILLPKPLA
ncbi:MAG: UDP-N-acetylmuramoyl-L-alanine--D-glutamate ligase [Candidatus Thioglobus sp.]|nr:UDP-N-acetylmuramoyl-L-alanine--D-glutamate ligase [Candidatus Thioglobus sp.]